MEHDLFELGEAQILHCCASLANQLAREKLLHKNSPVLCVTINGEGSGEYSRYRGLIRTFSERMENAVGLNPYWSLAFKNLTSFFRNESSRLAFNGKWQSFIGAISKKQLRDSHLFPEQVLGFFQEYSANGFRNRNANFKKDFLNNSVIALEAIRFYDSFVTRQVPKELGKLYATPLRTLPTTTCPEFDLGWTLEDVIFGINRGGLCWQYLSDVGDIPRGAIAFHYKSDKFTDSKIKEKASFVKQEIADLDCNLKERTNIAYSFSVIETQKNNENSWCQGEKEKFNHLRKLILKRHLESNRKFEPPLSKKILDTKGRSDFVDRLSIILSEMEKGAST